MYMKRLALRLTILEGSPFVRQIEKKTNNYFMQFGRKCRRIYGYTYIHAANSNKDTMLFFLFTNLTRIYIYIYIYTINS